MDNEKEWYPIAKKAIEDEFKNRFYITDFEITGYPPGKKIARRFLNYPTNICLPQTLWV